VRPGEKVSVLGAGGWGTALSIVLARRGYRVMLWARRGELAESISVTRENPIYLPGVRIPEGIQVSCDLEDAIRDSGLVVMAAPSHGIREVARMCRGLIPRGALVVSASKGLEVDTLKRMSQVIGEEMPSCMVTVLSGPNFAREVARGKPTASVSSSPKAPLAALVQDAFMDPMFRVYTNTDVIGVELGGALKNVYAIGAGIIDGKDMGLNAQAAFITRSLAEMIRLGVAMGARPLTFSGLSGMGDLVLTCFGQYSRNRWCGMELGRGRALEDILSQTRMVVEGVRTAQVAHNLALLHNVEMPIIHQIHAVLHRGRDPEGALMDLMTRDKKAEVDAGIDSWEALG